LFATSVPASNYYPNIYHCGVPGSGPELRQVFDHPAGLAVPRCRARSVAGRSRLPALALVDSLE
jgi:hypothetical protein